MIDWTEWGPPLGVIVFAAVTGGGLAFTLRRDDAEAGAIEDKGREADLRGRHDEALEALAALETQRDVMDPADYDAERKALLERGANAMRELEKEAGTAGTSGTGTGGTGGGDALTRGIAELTAALKRGEIDEVTFARAVAALSDQRSAAPAPPSSQAPPPPAAPRPPAVQKAAVAPAWQGAIYMLAGLALIGGLVYYANNQSVDRRDGASMTGNQDLGSQETPPAGQSGEPPWVSQQRQSALAALEADPNDVRALNALTQLSLGEPAKAWNYNEQARKADPSNVDAKMLHGVITAIMGMPEKAQEKFDEVIAEHPDHAATWAWKGLTYAEAKDWENTIKSLEKAKELGLSDHTIDNTLEMARNGGVRAEGGPMMGGNAPSPAPAAAGAVIASGVVNIDPNRSTFKAQTLFVNVKDPAAPGPPIAAKKLPPGPYPLAFTITEADRISMGGPMANRPIPDTVQLSLRLDADGNAFSKEPTDPQVQVDVTKGTKGLELMLK
ncbi:MAG: hypothetical protein H6737_18350 [Alphaproteobacteria bacterium]|nr:hypothetical protein [Alphaproteobacteria bacterium]